MTIERQHEDTEIHELVGKPCDALIAVQPAGDPSSILIMYLRVGAAGLVLQGIQMREKRFRIRFDGGLQIELVEDGDTVWLTHSGPAGIAAPH